MSSARTIAFQWALGQLFERATLRVTVRGADGQWGSENDQRAHVHSLRSAEGMAAAGGCAVWRARITVARDDGPPISSTRVREAAAAQSWAALRELVPPAVGTCIEAWRLYWAVRIHSFEERLT